MTKKIMVVMDAIHTISPLKDTTLAILLEAKKRGLDIFYAEARDLNLLNGRVQAYTRQIDVFDDENIWYQFLEDRPMLSKDVSDFDFIIMRKDPPVDQNFIYLTYLLEFANQNQAKVFNNPSSVLKTNEKIATNWFKDLIPDTLVSNSTNELMKFLKEHKDTIIKPLNQMGGRSIFKVASRDSNANVIFETMTNYDNDFCIIQKFIPQIAEGDKRILLINGEPYPYALARLPQKNENRGNLAAGGTAKVVRLTDRDEEICNIVKEKLMDIELIFVGLDVIGPYLTEINVTSPTCVRELEQFTKDNISASILDSMLNKI
ncbi:MAG: glutathione synthase [Pseudomonadota bacterium]|nr:glutathione synthase [Pseudomonadota bacterium]